MAKRGAFIVLEGLDRSGKSTQVARLTELLNGKGIKAAALNFPNRTTDTGAVINAYLQSGKELDDAAIHLLFSANRWEAAKGLRTRLNDGETLVVDRYAFSGVAFSAAKGTLSMDWCKGPDRGLPKPDLVLFLDVSAEVAKTRGGYGEERYEKQEFQEKVRQAFEKLRSGDADTNWQVVDANQPLDAVSDLIAAQAMQVVEKAGASPLSTLWGDAATI
ncbi:thymidylate kinase-domain-containing protein [Baffinella frigidus]|nr:thymidylate kinase-domain-containing protein [Cryptophyta sp. CCMP2293]